MRKLALTDNLHAQFVKEGGGLPIIAVVAVAIAASIVTAGAASAAIAAAQADAAITSFGVLAAGGSFAEAAAAGGVLMGSAFAAGGIANLAIAGAVGAMISSSVAQVGLTGTLDVGSVFKSGLAGAATGGMTGYFGSTYDLTRLIASGASGCASGALVGGGCENGAGAGLITGSLAWVGDAMRQDQIRSSTQFQGVVDSKTGETVSNASGPSGGIDGDGFKLAGTRVSVNDLNKYGSVSTNSDGTMIFSPTINQDTGQPWTVSQVLTKVGGATGGNQGLGGTIGGIPYQPGGAWDKIMESFAGPHDFLGSLTGYDGLGNLDTKIVGLKQTLFNLQTDIDIPLASVFALPTLLNQYGLSLGNIINQTRGASK